MVRPEIFISNTLSGKKEPIPYRDDPVTFYTCGPTVYSLIHIGNLRSGLVADLLVRTLRHLGQTVTYARNYTDIDDKIINRAKEESRDPGELAAAFAEEVEKDYAAAGMLEPDLKPRATEHIPEMIEMIEKIIASGQAYVTSSGEVLFAIEKFKGYGKLSKKQIDDLIAGARVEPSSEKKNPLDFSLWKAAKEGEPSWQSPWGKGRPGWHIECSAMSCKHFGAQIDLHHGGEDLIFPHHENEIAQSEAASGIAPFVGIWFHHAHLTLKEEKMSKSLGNVFLARDFLSAFGTEVSRYLLLHVHYRSKIDFNEELIDHALSALERIYEAKRDAVRLSRLKSKVTERRAEALWSNFVAQVESTKQSMRAALANDLNVPEQLAALFKLIREFNKSLKEPFAKSSANAALAAQAFLKLFDEELSQTLGVGGSDPEAFLETINSIRAAQHQSGGSLSKDEIEAKIKERNEAKKAKDFGRADEIRDELKSSGVLIQDSPSGTTWKYQ